MATIEESSRERMEEKVLKILEKNPNRRVPIGGWDFVDIPWEVIKSMERRGLIEICPFPQGKEIFIGLRK